MRRISTDRARRFCQALGDLSDRRPQRWRMLGSVAERLGVSCDDAETAANEAAAEGWQTMQGGHSVCLTDAGNRLDAAPTPKSTRRNAGQRGSKA